MFDEGQFHIADFGRGNAQQRKYSASKSDLLFPACRQAGLLLILGQAEERRKEWLYQDKKHENFFFGRLAKNEALEEHERRISIPLLQRGACPDPSGCPDCVGTNSDQSAGLVCRRPAITSANNRTIVGCIGALFQ